MKELEVSNLLSIDETIAKGIFSNIKYPWEVLPKIHDFIIDLGKTLDLNKFNKIGDNVWIAKSANISDTACILGPAIIDEETEIRHCAFIRENVIIGKKCVVGNSTEVKNSILFNEVQIPHFNYVGDSILGYKSHMGAGSILSNVRLDKDNVTIKYKEKRIQTDLRKFGSVLGDNVQVGCGSIINPGTIISKNILIKPT